MVLVSKIRHIYSHIYADVQNNKLRHPTDIN